MCQRVNLEALWIATGAQLMAEAANSTAEPAMASLFFQPYDGLVSARFAASATPRPGFLVSDKITRHVELRHKTDGRHGRCLRGLHDLGRLRPARRFRI